MSIERFRVRITVNLLGTEKRKLLVIEKSTNPRCFKSVELAKLDKPDKSRITHS